MKETRPLQVNTIKQLTAGHDKYNGATNASLKSFSNTIASETNHKVLADYTSGKVWKSNIEVEPPFIFPRILWAPLIRVISIYSCNRRHGHHSYTYEKTSTPSQKVPRKPFYLLNIFKHITYFYTRNYTKCCAGKNCATFSIVVFYEKIN